MLKYNVPMLNLKYTCPGTCDNMHVQSNNKSHPGRLDRSLDDLQDGGIVHVAWPWTVVHR